MRIGLIGSFFAAASFAQQPSPGDAIFDGRSLAGWAGDAAVWSVRDGALCGSTVGHHIAANTFLIWQGGEVEDFVLTCEVRLAGNNSGVQYRSRRLSADGFGVAGYQCDVHPQPDYFGMLYEEGGRGIVAQRGQRVQCDAGGKPVVTGAVAAPQPLDLDAWHRLRITARGHLLRHEVDGEVAVEVTDDSADAPRRGLLALQVHAGEAMTVWFRNLVLQRLPPAGAQPQWLWNGAPQPDQELWLRRCFLLEHLPTAALLAASGDNHCRVFVNGVRVLQSSTWEAPRTVDVGRHLRLGTNVLAVYAANDQGPAGLALRLCMRDGSGAGREIVSDADWRCRGEEVDGWLQPDFDDRQWAPATVLGGLGQKGLSWSERLGADALDGASFGDEPQHPVPATDVQVPPGFLCDLMLQVPRAMGSWVCLCSDAKGRLYASDQQRGLYRILLPSVGDVDPTTRIEPIGVDLEGCQGLCFAFGALYAVVNGPHSGLYRLRDRDGDDVLDEVELLRALPGEGEHGPHAVVPAPDGKHLFVLCGNHTGVPQLGHSRVPRNWREDGLLPRLDDPNGHAVGIAPPGGCLYLVDADGRDWELYCCGLRNAYDVAISPDGEPFATDADMEWDMGLPWYRPTRILRLCSGADYGWRSGSGKWLAGYPDSLPAVADIGPGSPTGAVFAPRSPRFGAFAGALLCCDWTYGIVYALPQSQQPTQFAIGAPLPLTDIAVGKDDALFVLTGGRGLPSRLYRILGTHPAQGRLPRLTAPAAMLQRRQVEAFHGRVDAAAVAAALPLLGSGDATVRHAARIAIESQPVGQWRELALQLPADPAQPLLTMLLALARQGEAADLLPLTAKLGGIAIERFDASMQLAWLRTQALALLRLGELPADRRAALSTRLLRWFPSGNDLVDGELCALLARLDAPGLLDAALPQLEPLRPAAPPPWLALAGRNPAYGNAIAAMVQDMPPTAQLALANALRTVSHGWTLAQRQAFFRCLGEARGRRGGASYDGYLVAMIDAAWANCTAAEQQALAPLVGKVKAPLPPFRGTRPKGPGRHWEMVEALPLVQNGMQQRDFAAGRNLFFAASCAACHRFAGDGGSIGPDLTSLGNKFAARDVLESVLEPSKVVSDQFGGSLLHKRDGSTLFGRVTAVVENGKTTAYDVFPAVADPKLVRVNATEVATVTTSKQSPMPPGLVDALNPDELLDLIAYLVSRGDPQGPLFKK